MPVFYIFNKCSKFCLSNFRIFNNKIFMILHN